MEFYGKQDAAEKSCCLNKEVKTEENKINISDYVSVINNHDFFFNNVYSKEDVEVRKEKPGTFCSEFIDGWPVDTPEEQKVREELQKRKTDSKQQYENFMYIFFFFFFFFFYGGWLLIIVIICCVFFF
jgi:hypothetical protein